jgi:hypothetical protein
MLATKLLDIGKSILRTCYEGSNSAPEEGKAHDAIRWMQKAFFVIEPLDCTTNAELRELKVRGFQHADPFSLNPC